MASVVTKMYKWSTVIYLSVGALFVLALVVTLDRGSLVSAAQTDLTSVYIDDELPISDASSPLWNMAPEAEVPLSGQMIAPPFNVDGHINTIRTRSIHNGTWVAFRMEWEDSTMNEGGGSDDYRDSVALQFPVHGGEPFVCMGFVDSEVNILHWRADFQRVIEDGPLGINDIFPNAKVNIYNQADDPIFAPARSLGNPIATGEKPSAVEDLIATGFGTLESQEQVNTTGWGNWDGEKWSVVIARPLITSDEQDTQFKTGTETPVALAVWNGEEREVNGKKSVSAWINVAVENIPTAEGPTIDTPTVGNFTRAPVVIDNSSNSMLWALTGVLASLVAVVVFVPVVIFFTGRRKTT